MKDDPCGCQRCNEARMLAAWCLLAEVDNAKARVSANLLLSRWERVMAAGDSPIASSPRQHELEAMEYCATWIRDNRGSLARLARDVGVAGKVVDR